MTPPWARAVRNVVGPCKVAVRRGFFQDLIAVTRLNLLHHSLDSMTVGESQGVIRLALRDLSLGDMSSSGLHYP